MISGLGFPSLIVSDNGPWSPKFHKQSQGPAQRPSGCSDSSDDPQQGRAIGVSDPPITYEYGTFRVLGLRGSRVFCDSPVFVFGMFEKIRDKTVDCTASDAMELVLPPGEFPPFANISYGSDLRELLLNSQKTGILGLDIDASAGASIGFDGSTVHLTVEGRVKVKAGWVTLLDVSGSVSQSKDLADLNPCGNFENVQGPLRIRGRLCVDGLRVCLRDGKLDADFDGGWHEVCGIPDACVDIGGRKKAVCSPKEVPAVCECNR